MSILMVLTSHDRLGDTGKPTGLWLEEFATPYYIFRDEGVKVVLASPKGGRPPIDPRSEEPQAQTDSTRRFFKDKEALEAFENTAELSTINPSDYGAVFFPGGHGPLWDLSEDPHSIKIIETLFAAGKPVGAVCHGPAVFRHTKEPGRRASRPRKIGDGLFEFGRSRSRPNRGRTFPRRGYAERERRQLLQGRELAALCAHRRKSRDRAEPEILGGGCMVVSGQAFEPGNSERTRIYGCVALQGSASPNETPRVEVWHASPRFRS